MSLRGLPKPTLLLSPHGSHDRNGPVEPDIQGGAIIVPGLRGPAWQVAEATTNYVRNPRCAHDTTGWATGSNREITRRDDLPTGIPAGVRTGLRVRATSTISGGFTGAATAITYNNAGDYTGSMYVYVPSSYSSGDLIVQLVVSGSSRSSLVDMSIRDEWQRVVTPTFEDVAAAATGSIQIAHLSGTWNADDEFYISCAQVEPKAYATPYCDGALGAGHAWTGTPHDSTSTRAGAMVRTPSAGRLDATQGEVQIRLHTLPDFFPGSGRYNDIWRAQAIGNHFLIFASGTHSLTFGAGATAQHHNPDLIPPQPLTLGMAWKIGERSRYFVNGEEVTTSAVLNAPLQLSSVMSLGAGNDADKFLAESLIVFDRPLTERERRSLIEHPRAWSWYELTAPGLVTNVPRPRGVFSIQAELWRADRYGNLLERVP
uniref:phage head spike fiber domain-containing protein n=1 Tax=Microbacterium sp. TaxID=51671 RepID=UPI0026340595